MTDFYELKISYGQKTHRRRFPEKQQRPRSQKLLPLQ